MWLSAPQGDELSRREIQVLLRFLNEADVTTDRHEVDLDDTLRQRSRALRKSRSPPSKPLSRFTSRGAGTNVKDRAYNQDTRSVSVPKAFGRQRGERVQKLLRQLRQRRQQRQQQYEARQQLRQARQQLTLNLAVDADVVTRSQQQPPQAAAAGSGGAADMAGQPAATSSKSGWLGALSRVKAAIQKAAGDTQPAVQQASAAGGTASGLQQQQVVTDKLSQQLQQLLEARQTAATSGSRNARSSVVIALVPLEQLSNIELAWENLVAAQRNFTA
jgi:hypothetical protein